jgi:hypothetical protein
MSNPSAITNGADMSQEEVLLNAFQTHYHRFSSTIHDAVASNADSTVLARLGDDLDKYYNLVLEVKFLYLSFHGSLHKLI